jgi:hypothetical protein
LPAELGNKALALWQLSHRTQKPAPIRVIQEQRSRSVPAIHHACPAVALREGG